jgi:hypothetical protein
MKLIDKLISEPVSFTDPSPFPQYLKSVLILFPILLLTFLKTSSQQVYLPNFFTYKRAPNFSYTPSLLEVLRSLFTSIIKIHG